MCRLSFAKKVWEPNSFHQRWAAGYLATSMLEESERGAAGEGRRKVRLSFCEGFCCVALCSLVDFCVAAGYARVCGHPGARCPS